MATIAPYDFDCHVEWAGFIADEPAFALVDGSVEFPVGSIKSVKLHEGLLSASLSVDGQSLITGGEDGNVMQVLANGAPRKIAEMGSKWIDVVAGGPHGSVAFAAGRTAWIATADGALKEIPHERAVEGLAFAPKGMRLACARYNGVSLHWMAGQEKPVDLHWDGAHTGVTFSPDGKYVVTSMVENALHGWRMDNKKTGDGKHMRMSGYPSKPKSLSWSAKGKWLASSGAPAAICWPFGGKDGPMGKAPKELGAHGDNIVLQVACHPTEDVVAIGYADGMVMAVRFEDAAENLLRRPGKSGVTSLNWDRDGMRLAYGCEDGEAGIISL